MQLSILLYMYASYDQVGLIFAAAFYQQCYSSYFEVFYRKEAYLLFK